MERLLVLYIAFCIFPFVCKSVDQASFYGGSYIKIPLKEAKSTTDVRLKFRTQLPSGLLLLTAGATDYCVIYLESGSLKAKINLGAGESELSSPQGLILNDLKWHEVILKRKEANISLLIDDVPLVQKYLSGNFFELNIDFGVFIGGKGVFSELFLGHLENFRGCMAEIEYNGMYLLDRARRRQEQAQVHAVTWNCATEFEVDAGQEISFVEDGAYVTVSYIPMRPTLRWHMEFKTNIDQCIFLYSTDFSTKLSLLALEIWDGKLKLTLKYNNVNINLTNDKPVSDGHWHKVIVQISSTVDLIVDSVPRFTFLSRTASTRHSEFPDHFSIGGIQVEKRSRAMAKGLKTSDINFKGCVKNIIVDDYKIGLSNVKATEGVRPGCIWHYPCLSNPCSKNSICVQKGIDSFHCKCDAYHCINSGSTKEYKVFSNSSLATDLELLFVKLLQVVEGENVLITTVNLHLVLDYHKYGIRDSGIIFHVVKSPAHGTLYVDIWPRKENSFTMLDLSRDKVRYVHDGSETVKDEIVMELELSSGESFILPAYLQGKNRFILPIIITPNNDPPVLDIPTTTVLRIAQGAEEIVTNKILQVKDPDTVTQELMYNVLPQDKKLVGHFERLGEPGIVLTSFSQQDIDNKQVKFVHHGSTQTLSNIALQVSDGIESSKIAFLRISTFTQHLRLQNNTGIMLVHKTSVILTSYNLSFVSNVKGAIGNVKFSLVSQPQFGMIEVEQYDKPGTWNNVDYFTSDEIDQHRVRYRHINGSPTHDEFKFFSSLRNVNSTIYSFRMVFTKLNLLEIKTKTVILKLSESAILSNEHLLYTTEPLWTNPLFIQYRILKNPLYGKLVLHSKRNLQRESTFSQEDVNLRNIQYQLLRYPYSNITDSAIFIVSAPGCTNVTTNLSFLYYVTSELSSKVHVILKTLEVEEGASINITLSNLNLKIETVNDFIFNITRAPNHGLLQILNEKRKKFRNNTNYFTLNELLNNEVFYIHDDSESTHDAFTFLALSNEEENAQYVGELNVNIVLKNDNSPVRSVDKVLHVVIDGEKLITGNDLAYTDADINTKPSDIVYSCREIRNGALYRVNALSENIFEFTQEDLNMNLILFKHKGDNYGKIKFWISDGHSNVNGFLEVRASTPFIKIFTPVKITLEQGKSFRILPQHFRITTNLNTKDENIFYEIMNKPQHGKISFINKNKELQRFTHVDVVSKKVVYNHDGSSTAFDEVILKVQYETYSDTLNLNFRILPSNYWKPLLLVANNTLVVEESTSIKIIKENLEIMQYEIPANIITYYVMEPPRNGYLDIDMGTKHKENIVDRQFTQEIINANRVRYIQSSANETKDRIVFNVTNGVMWLNNVILNIIVVPEYLYLTSVPLNVREGSDVILTKTNLIIITEYYKNMVSDYLIIQFPKFGCLKRNNQCITINNFSQKDLEKEILKYSHDGTENLKDEITLVAIAEQKRSVPVLISINIEPVNDQKPIVVNNTGLIMWEGGAVEITSEMLSTVDNDKPKDTITYVVKGCWWGNVTLKTNPEYAIQTFTQNDVDKGLVMFRHANGSETKFVFTVTDGVHATKEKSFKIITKLVTLSLVRLSDLHVFPLHRSFLSANDLLVISSDPDRAITFEVTNPPNIGRLMMETEIPGNFRIVQTFSQSQINETKIFYEHTHPFSGLYANDSFTFNILADRSTTIHNKKMLIDISVSSGGLDSYVAVPKIEVIEGGLTSIHLNLSEVVTFLESHTGISAPIIHISASQPSHGYVYLAENANMSVFTQVQIEHGNVKYQHDHSDSHNDSVHLSLYLIPGYINLCNITVGIKVKPINDQPFKLVTVAPRITVVQGENYTISRNDLLTEDADTEPVDLQYDIITGPDQGKLLFISNNNKIQQTTTVNKFTQADIDSKRLMYVHSGDALQTTFYFRVWDGKFKPEYTLFNIQIMPVLINVTSGIPVYLQQGSNVASLALDQFVIHTNANKNRIHFTLTKVPFHGIIYVKDIPSNNFVYNDLYDKSVMYMQTDMSSANDTFKVFVGVSTENKNIGTVTDVTVKVQPLMQIGNISVVSGSKIKLTLSVLDATPLAKLTSSNPKYVLMQNPLYGEIRKIIRSSGEKRNVIDNSVSNFTHEEIKSGLIYYVARNVKSNWKGIEERIVFLLSTIIFQPAVGEVRFRIWATSLDKSNLLEPRDPAGHEGGMHTATPNITNDYFLALTVITAIVVCGIIIIIIIKCRHVNCKKKDKEGQCVQPIQLPKPPDQLMPMSPYMKRYMSDNISVPTALTAQIPASVSVPQCKVTLLRPVDSMDNSELDVHARYPYGASDDQTEDWSSYDTSDPAYSTHNTNLMLRKNQYWV